jgi:hypothetical protein
VKVNLQPFRFPIRSRKGFVCVSRIPHAPLLESAKTKQELFNAKCPKLPDSDLPSLGKSFTRQQPHNRESLNTNCKINSKECKEIYNLDVYHKDYPVASGKRDVQSQTINLTLEVNECFDLLAMVLIVMRIPLQCF